MVRTPDECPGINDIDPDTPGVRRPEIHVIQACVNIRGLHLDYAKRHIPGSGSFKATAKEHENALIMACYTGILRDPATTAPSNATTSSTPA